MLPPLDIVGPDGVPLTVRSIEPTDTVERLAQCLDVPTIWTDRELEASERLVTIDDLCIGTRVSASDPQLGGVAAGDHRDHSFEVAVVSGPAVTRSRSVGVGRHLIGRSPLASVRIEDPSVELHHALLQIDADANATVTQLSGAVPIRVGGEPWNGAVTGETVVSIGSSRLRIRRVVQGAHDLEGMVGSSPAGSLAAHPTDPWRRVVRRAPPNLESWEARPLVAPAPLNEPRRPSPTGLIGTAVTAVGAVVIATVVGNAMFMLFASMGVLAAVTTFIVGVISARRERSRLRARHAENVAEFATAVEDLRERRRGSHRRLHRTLSDTFDEVFDGKTRIWERRLTVSDDVLDSDGPMGELRGVVGSGTCRWNPPIEVSDRSAFDGALLARIERCARLDGAAAPMSLAPGDAVAFHGALDSARSILRSLIVQFATWVGPADWQLVVLSRDRSVWSWVDWLPHGAVGRTAFVALGENGAGGDRDVIDEALESIDHSRFTVVVTDEPDLYAIRTGPLRRFLTASSAASLVAVDTGATVPPICRRVLTVGAAGSASWSGEVGAADDAVDIAFAGVSVEAADEVARRLACLVDPEDDEAASGVPSVVTLGDLLGDTSADAIARRWSDGGVDPAPSAPLGMSADGRVDIDLVRDGPHGLIAGTTGAGKSELLRSLVISLAASVAPEHLCFVLVDYKGGSTFDACVELPHTVGLVTDLDEGLAERALVSLDAELHRRERKLRSVGASDLTEYRATSDEGAEPIARLVVVIDEFAALAKELPDFLSALVGIAQRGRSLGVHLLLATQRPAGVVGDDIRANTNLRLALRLHDTSDAVDVVGDQLPATFPRGAPGRSALRLGPEELTVFQTARCTGPVATRETTGMVVESVGRSDPDVDGEDEAAGVATGRSELEAVVEAINAAASTHGRVSPHRPWVEPLPFPLTSRELLGGTAIGWIDVPARQRREPLSWHPSDGGLALIGSIGSGTTSTLIALAAAACGVFQPAELHLYVIDARGDDGLAALASLAHCGGVVRIAEDERLHRLLARLVDAIDRRMGADGTAGSVDHELVVMIDGYGSLRASLGSIERQATFELLQRVVNDGPAVGVALVVADAGSPSISTVPVAQRWLFHLDDPDIARGFGVRSLPVAPGRPGRLRIASSGLEAQVGQGAPGLAALPSRDDACVGGPASISTLPERIRTHELPPPDAAAVDRRAGSKLVIGVAADDLGAAAVELLDGDHLLIVGGPRTGVSTALACVAAAWETAAVAREEGCRIVRIDRVTPIDRVVLDEVVADTATRSALVIDDAHRVVDPGRIAEIVAGDHPHITILAAGRADAVRSGYGHWSRELAKARCGIVLASRGDPDGDILGVQIPRRPLIAPRPGLAWIVDGGPLRQVQIALP